MDPNEALRTLRKAIARRNEYRDAGNHYADEYESSLAARAYETADDAAHEAADAAAALDKWLSKGGFLPDDWKPVRFHCPAVMYHGPGHMSRTRCGRTSPHELSDEHYAKNPMEPGFQWVGERGAE